MRTSKANKHKILALLVLTICIGIVSMLIGFREKKTIKYYYIENNNIDYKVYLKKNSFFDLPYLEKDKTYITSLIDYIDADFSYNIDFSDPVTGSIEYQLVAQINADKKSDIGNYWTKEYELTPSQVDEIKGKSYSLNVNQNIEYNKYNEILEEFISKYSLSSDSNLKVYLRVKGKVKIDHTKQELDISSSPSLEIELSKLAVDGKINVNNKNTKNELSVNNKKDNVKSFVFKVCFFVDIILIFIFLYQYVEVVRIDKKHFTYRKRIKKINNEYESIITKVKNTNFEKFTIIDVKSFDDLLNVYNNVREPINCKNGLEKTIYFIINDNTCYVYTILNEEFEIW